MTYCVAIKVDEGLIFASDSRTSANADHILTYSKMYTYGAQHDRQIVLLAAGNLATTQAVISQVDDDIAANRDYCLLKKLSMEDVARYIGSVLKYEQQKYVDAAGQSSFNAEASFIVGGQIAGQEPVIFLVYPQGNYITSSEQTRYLQIGEFKYGKAILDRIIHRATSLDDASLCALVSMDSTMRSNATVGPPIELLSYQKDSLRLSQYVNLVEGNAYFDDLLQQWNSRLVTAFKALPAIEWGGSKKYNWLKLE